jgi:hypothetical protein
LSHLPSARRKARAGRERIEHASDERAEARGAGEGKARARNAPHVIRHFLSFFSQTV